MEKIALGLAALAAFLLFGHSSTPAAGSAPPVGASGDESTLTPYQTRQLLNALHSLGYSVSTLLDSTSRGGIRTFQADHGIAQSGALDLDTRTQIQSIWLATSGVPLLMTPPRPMQARPLPIPPFPVAPATTGTDAQNALIRVVQTQLGDLGSTSLVVTGAMDTATVNAARAWAAANSVPLGDDSVLVLAIDDAYRRQFALGAA